MGVTINLGHLPDPPLSPNKRLHYMALYQAKDAGRDQVMISDSADVQ